MSTVAKQQLIRAHKYREENVNVAINQAASLSIIFCFSEVRPEISMSFR